MAAGLSIFSYQQRHDLNGKPYPGVRYYFYRADTSDPIDIYRDPTLAAKHQNPVAADAWGVLPAVFIPDTVLYYRVRVTTAAGGILSDDAIVANMIPTSGGGDPPTPIPVDAVFKTGDVKHRYDEGIHEGWLPCNGRTFGSSISGADYASDDFEGLFLFLWAKDSSKTVGGAGANAAADWQANKQFTLPDMRGRALVGLDDMDASAAGVVTGLDTLGETIGAQSKVLSQAELPAHTHSDGSLKAANHGHPTYVSTGMNDTSNPTGGITLESSNVDSFPAYTGAPGATAGHQIGGSGEIDITGETGSVGSGTAFSIVQPSVGVSIYIKT